METTSLLKGRTSPGTLRSRLGTWLGMLVAIPLVIGMIGIFGLIGFGSIASAFEDAGRADWEQAAAIGLFGLFIGGGMVCWLCLAAVGFWQDRKDRAMKAAHPDEPWFWRCDWRAARMANRLDALRVVGLVWLTALGLVFVVLFFQIGKQWRSHDGWEQFGKVAWTILSVFILWATCYSFLLPALRRWRFGASSLVLHNPGGPDLQRFESTLHVPRHGAGPVEFQVTLREVERVEVEGAECNEIVERSISSIASTQTFSTTGRPLEIPVSFDLPAESASTASMDPNTIGRAWKLEVIGKRRWFDYRAEFEVPVFRRAAPDKSIPTKQL